MHNIINIQPIQRIWSFSLKYLLFISAMSDKAPSHFRGAFSLCKLKWMFNDFTQRVQVSSGISFWGMIRSKQIVISIAASIVIISAVVKMNSVLYVIKTYLLPTRYRYDPGRLRHNHMRKKLEKIQKCNILD